MNRIVQNLTRENMDKVHAVSLRILKEVGIRFHTPEAANCFAEHGVKIEGEVVFLSEKDVETALATVPSTFMLEARNPQKSITIGGGNHVFGPGYGAPVVVEGDGTQRPATLEDYKKFCKLTQTSSCLDLLGSIMVQPNELPAETCHLDMLLQNFTLSDKPTMGSTGSRQACEDTMNMARIVYGSLERPVVLGLVNSLAPLQYADDMTEALIDYATNGQPVIVHGGATMGSTGPITEAGTQAMQNAMNLAGICLTQIVNPGTPVIYGFGGTPLDMKTGGYTIGSPELARCASMGGQMGVYYHIPTRAGGAFTDALVCDFQAGMESALMLTSVAASGVNLSLHCCGIVGAFIGMSYEKFIADELLCGMVKKLIQPADYTDEEFAFDLIKQVGIGGQYLSQMHTVKRCRSAFFHSDLPNKVGYDKWREQDAKWTHEKAAEEVLKRLEAYRQPEMDPETLASLENFIADRKK